ncbi:MULTISPECIES: ABC transporter ATP-binding protein/permease [Rhodococcus]|uniref:ABC transporter ATP-binding protein/permease n=1 Tax=Rhodococcus TaxID=1827 RepID=UPI00193B1345|nr:MULTISPECIES: ABC transporter ATP-binding protein/permease [Rhodococcus]QRI74129.1 ABC transporter ATP-binding protein/permease [Rhodococcus aetherivorans]QSE57538.1 ABC transporter ATP-binding protein/permease [Rhodococcus sp. PSBB066]QSE71126.1 ABC transporter ATP-binding protein/permease [Rhodococcus sp. PSBB049]
MEWGSVLVDSVWWTLKAYVITTVVFVVVVALLARTTHWGRQWWRIAWPYFDPRRGLGPLGLVALVLLFTVFAVRMNVLFSYWYNDFYTAIQDLDEAAFWRFMRVFAVLAIIHVARSLVAYLLGQTLDIHWRTQLNNRLVDTWLDTGAFYRDRFVDKPVDNPDQRIQVDVTDFVTTTRVLSMGAVTAVLSIVSFTGILWDLSGPITVFGTEIPRGMVFLVYIYVLVTTAVAFWIGRPLIRLNFLNEKLGATYRYALVRVREYGENIAFYHGENVERGGLLGRFAAVIRNWWRIVFRILKFDGFNLTVNQIAVIFPFLIQGPRLFAGQVTLGDVMQTGNAFGQVHESLSFFRESYDDFAAFRATTIRLNGLVDATDQSAKLPVLVATEQGDTLDLRGLDVRTPAGRPLVTGLDIHVSPGEALLVRGASGSGKTTLLRSLAGLWPYAHGRIARPDGDALFLSQDPYVPLGTLREALSYPRPPVRDEAELGEVLERVHLGHLRERLDDDTDWARVLSPGEQQRLGFARVLLARPRTVFLDEATAAVDEGLEHALYRTVREALPDSVIVSVGHRSTLDSFHDRVLELQGEGRWTVTESVR